MFSGALFVTILIYILIRRLKGSRISPVVVEKWKNVNGIESLDGIDQYSCCLFDEQVYKSILFQDGGIMKTDIGNLRVLMISYMDSNRILGHYSLYTFKLNQMFAYVQNISILILTNTTTLRRETDPRWEKVRILLNVLEFQLQLSESEPSFDYFIWFDADLIFLRNDPLISLFNDNSVLEGNLFNHLIMWISSEMHAETGIANTGCFVVENSKPGMWLFILWYNMMDHSIGHDQILFDHLYSLLLHLFSYIKLGSVIAEEHIFSLLKAYPSRSVRIDRYEFYSMALISLLQYYGNDAYQTRPLSFIKLLPSDTLNSIPPVYLTFQPKHHSILHLMGESDNFRLVVFRSLFNNYLSQLEHNYHSTESTIGSTLEYNVTRFWLQELFFNLSESTIRHHHIAIMKIIKNLRSFETLEIEKINPLFIDLATALAELRELLLLLDKFPASDLFRLASHTYLIITFHEYQIYRLSQHYDVLLVLQSLYETWLKPICSFTNVITRDGTALRYQSSSCRMRLEFLHYLTSISNDLLTRFTGSEGYFIDLPVLANESGASCGLLYQYHPYCRINNNSLRYDFNLSLKYQLFNITTYWFDELLQEAHASHGDLTRTIHSMRNIFLLNSCSFHLELIHPFSSEVDKLQLLSTALVNAKTAFESYQTVIFPNMISSALMVSEAELRMYYQSDPVTMYQYFHAIATMASVFTHVFDAITTTHLNTLPKDMEELVGQDGEQSNGLSSVGMVPKISLLSLKYYDCVIAMIEFLLPTLFPVQENHFKLVQLYSERIQFQIKFHHYLLVTSQVPLIRRRGSNCVNGSDWILSYEAAVSRQYHYVQTLESYLKLLGQYKASFSALEAKMYRFVQKILTSKRSWSDFASTDEMLNRLREIKTDNSQNKKKFRRKRRESE